LAKKTTSPVPPDDDAYERHKDRAAARQREQSHVSNDVAPFPAVVNQPLVDRCKDDLGLFLKSFFPRTFRLPFSDDHKKIIAKCEQSVNEGGLFALASPRGTGKTAIAQCTSIWAKLYGKRRFTPIVGPDAGHANRMLRNIKAELRFNDVLLGGFPLVCYPIRRLQGKAIKAASQHDSGIETRIVWSEGKLVMPTVNGSPASGGIITVAGITGQIRGMNEVTSDGGLLRPDFVIVDDFQTHESAYSASQCDTRLSVILADILELAGPGVEMCGIILCTVIRKGDAADQLLDRKLHPEFRGERMKAVYSFPKNEEWWTNYGEVLRRGLEEDESIERANTLYRSERATADEGAVIAWPERFKKTEVSAVQSMMNVKILKPDVFDAEYQNEPKTLSLDSLSDVSPTLLATKLNTLPRGTVPLSATKITIGVDVGKVILYYVVCAWDNDFTGAVIDYGTWPDQQRRYFLTHQIQRPLAKAHPDRQDLEGQVYAGMEALTRKLIGMEWKRDVDSGIMRVSRQLIDGNWPEAINVVYQFCRQSEHAPILLPSRGAYVGARKRGINEHAKRDGERPGLEWTIPPTTKREVTHVRWDTNFWKSHVLSRLTTPIGSRGSLAIFGGNKPDHQMFFDHLCSERRIEMIGPEKTVMEWEQDKSKENHWWDCLVMAAVGASVEGISLAGVHRGTKVEAVVPVDYAALYAKARGG
jgi:Phage terminase large subunit (GpA)